MTRKRINPTASPLDSLIHDVITATAGTFVPFWALAFYASDSMTGTLEERSNVVESAYSRIRGDAPEGKRPTISASSVRQLVACARLWGDAVKDNENRQKRMHPFTAYAHRAAARGADKKRLTGDALGEAYDSISGTPKRKEREPDGLVTVRVTVDVKERLTALAETSGLDVPTIVAALLDSHANSAS